MDEPFASLAEAPADDLRDLLRQIAERTGGTILFVTHNVEEAVRLADRIVMLDGQPARIVRDVPVELSPAARRDPAAVARARERLRSGEPPGDGPLRPARAAGGTR
jgi:ABC-type nitrate/sulfonate/bicarbonate transport system ATPase subunit